MDALIVLSDPWSGETAPSDPMGQGSRGPRGPKSKEDWAHFFEPKSVAIIGTGISENGFHDLVFSGPVNSLAYNHRKFRLKVHFPKAC